MSESRKITNQERHCISDCIRKHWGESSSRKENQNRDNAYVECLSECQVCG